MTKSLMIMGRWD